jgi:hypothetical protein
LIATGRFRDTIESTVGEIVPVIKVLLVWEEDGITGDVAIVGFKERNARKALIPCECL